MIMKAPKDMNAVEFVDFLINGNVLPSVPDDDSFIQIRIVKDVLKRPAPNPFTEDQLATMREYQRNGINFAVNNNRVLLFYADEPQIVDHMWKSKSEPLFTISSDLSFLGKELASLEVICFADYAPLEE